MSTVINLADARARGIELPADNDVAQDILDEQEAWLARKIGALTGDRTERFWVGISATEGKLGLRRYTDEVAVTDGGSLVNASHYRLIDTGAAIVRTHTSPIRYWTGPYVDVTYEPNDEALVRSALYDLVAMAADPATPYESESLGDYSYSRGTGAGAIAAKRAALISSLLPKRDSLTTIYAYQRLLPADPRTVINMPEIDVFP